jgi:PAS domain S-box/diguanylate cyclase (GGDEF) domain
MSPAGHLPVTEDSVELLRVQLCSLQTSIDISDQTIVEFRQQAEASLSNIGSKLSPFLRDLPCLAYIKDSDGRYLYVNRHWEQVYGKSFRDWHNKTDHDFWPEEIADELRRNDKEVLSRRTPLQTVEVAPGELGMAMCLVTKFPLENRSGACGLLGGIAVDISERKRSEDARYESWKLYREVFDTAPAGIHRSTFDGQVLLANPALLKMLGYERADQLPRPMSTFSLVSKPQAETGPEDVQITQESWKKRDGSEIYIRQTARVVRDEAGCALYYDAVVEDITLQRQAELLEKDRNRLLEMMANNERLGRIFEQLTALVERQSPGGHCSIMVVRGEKLHSAARGSVPEAFYSALHDGIEIGPDGGPCGSAAFHGRPVAIDDMAADRGVLPYRDIALANDLRACWSVPIRSGDQKTLGTLAVYYNRPCSPLPSEITLLEMTSRLAAVAIEHRQLYDDLTYRALYDNITGLANRVLFQDRFEDVLEMARWGKTQAALLWVDLDGFKDVNDTLGHRVGDIELAKVGSRFARCLRPAEMVARMGETSLPSSFPLSPDELRPKSAPRACYAPSIHPSP